MKVIHRIILISLLCFGCSNSNELTGTWFQIKGDHFAHTFWEIKSTGEVIVQKYDGQKLTKYLHLSDNDEYLIESEASTDSINMGFLMLKDSNSISFSNGYYFYRIKEPTSTTLTQDAFISNLTKGSLTLSSGYPIKSMYFSDSINRYGFKSVDILYDTDSQAADINANWGFQEYNGFYAISFVQYDFQVSTILIDSISDHEISGTVVFDSIAIPIVFNISEPTDSDTSSDKIERTLSDSQWYSSHKNEIVDTDTSLNAVFMEALYNESYLEYEYVESANFRVDFKDNQILTIRTETDLVSFEKTFMYTITPDSKYIFIYDRFRHATYSELTSLHENQSQLTLFINLPIIYKNKGYVEETVKIQLIR